MVKRMQRAGYLYQVTLRQNAFIVPCVNFPTGTNMHFFMTFIWVSYDTQVHLIRVKCILSLLVFRHEFVFLVFDFFLSISSFSNYFLNGHICIENSLRERNTL